MVSYRAPARVRALGSTTSVDDCFSTVTDIKSDLNRELESPRTSRKRRKTFGLTASLASVLLLAAFPALAQFAPKNPAAYDKNRDRLLSLEEYGNYLRANKKATGRLEERFKAIDLNGDGQLSLRELWKSQRKSSKD